MDATFQNSGAGTNPPPPYNTIFEHLQSQNQILNSNNPFWSSIIPRNEPTEAVASVPIVGENTSRNRANQREKSKNGREVLSDAEKKLRRKMRNRESAIRSRDRKKAYTAQLESDFEELQKKNSILKKRLKDILMAQESLPRKKQKQTQSSFL